MTILVAVVLLCAACAGAVLVISYVVAWRLTRPGRHTYWDEYTFVPSDMGVPYEDVRLTTSDGLTLAGWLMERPRSDTVIIVVSGYRDRKTNLLPVAAGLWRHGLSVLLLDFRNQGSSDMDSAQTMGQRELLDMKAALDLVEQRFAGQRIGALGWSMGAVVCLETAVRDQRIGAVVADSAFTDQTSLIAFNFAQTTRLPAWPFTALATLFVRARAGYWPQRARPVDSIAAIAPRPLLLIHGEQDDMCPVQHAHRLYAAAKEPKELWLAPQAKHVGAYFADPAAYIGRVAAFFARRLPARSQRGAGTPHDMKPC